MRYRKTYGINGLLEWHGIVESHGVKMKVDFTNGSVTAYGVAPATFTTEHALTQHIMENSEQFKSGRIRCVMAVALPGDEPKEEAGEAGDELTKVNVSSLAEAKEYLMENFEVTSSKLKSRAMIVEQAKANGVEFVWE